MKLKRPLPPGRTLEQIENHYLVEKEIAGKLKAASREERKEICRTMYDELFERVPDHPRLARSRSPELVAASNRKKLAVVGRFIHRETVFAEFAPGDCCFAREVAGLVKRVYAIDISNQCRAGNALPANLHPIVYDGYDLDLESDSVDTVFSDHLIEHIHPEDIAHHFMLVRRILKKNGTYVFRTPHAVSGPHDVSGHFSDVPEGFHLKEWTYAELGRIAADLGFDRLLAFWQRRDINIRVPLRYCSYTERLLGRSPRRVARRLASILLPSICAAAVK